jgi:hypothetical protein
MSLWPRELAFKLADRVGTSRLLTGIPRTLEHRRFLLDAAAANLDNVLLSSNGAP